MSAPTPIYCAGSVLWDVIGRAPGTMAAGSDVAGRIVETAGGVAMNVAKALRRHGLDVALLTALGRDAAGEKLAALAQGLGMSTEFILWSDTLPTDRYMAIEDQNGVVAAIADATTLEAVGSAIFTTFFATETTPGTDCFRGTLVIDGNLPTAVLHDLSNDTRLSAADVRVVPASPGKAERVSVFLNKPNCTLYLNLREAAILGGMDFTTAEEAAKSQKQRGVGRVIVTNGAAEATLADAGGATSLLPPTVEVAQRTGAGDAFLAAHLAAERLGQSNTLAFAYGLASAAAHVASGTAQ